MQQNWSDAQLLPPKGLRLRKLPPLPLTAHSPPGLATMVVTPAKGGRGGGIEGGELGGAGGVGGVRGGGGVIGGLGGNGGAEGGGGNSGGSEGGGGESGGDGGDGGAGAMR